MNHAVPGPVHRFPEILRRPEQGWSSLLLLLGMLVVVGMSVTDSRPLLIGEEDRTGALVPAMLAAGLIGYLLARSSIGVVRAHVIGAAAGAFVLLMVAGAAVQESGTLVPPGWEELRDRVAALGVSLDEAIATYGDDRGAMPTVATLLVLGAICWTTAQFSAFSVFRYDRGGPAVMATGVILFLNVGLEAIETAGSLPVLPVLALFSALSMLLLMRLQLRQQGQQWVRRHIADTSEVGRLFLRTGTLFVALTILSASSLTLVAMAPQQEVDVGALEEPLEDVAEELSRLLAFVAVPALQETQVRPGDRFEVQDVWKFDDGLAFTVSLDGPLMGNYWWGWAADEFDGHTWRRERGDRTDVAAGRPLSIPPEASAAGPHPLTANITVGDAAFALGTVFAPAEPIEISEAVTVRSIDRRRGIGDITFEDPLEPGDAYTAETLVRDYDHGGRSLTAQTLREADTRYRDWTEPYLQGAGTDASGDLARQMAARILDSHDNPYDRALAVQDELREFDYEPDISGLCPDGMSVPQCLLTYERGFCQQYASTMVMVLREMGIPSRYVTGYLPGELVGDEWQVELKAFHTWVEAYFPGIGWVRFDPTPADVGLNQQATDFPDEDSRPTRDPRATDEPALPEETADPFEDFTFAPDETDALPPPGGDDPMSTLLTVGLLAATALVVVFGLLFIRLRRLGHPEGGLAYRGIVSLATRLGYGPHPAQTEYEYAGALAETIPTVRDDLYLVADARVETAYGQRQLDKERQGALRRAYARIRTALLRLSLRLRR